VKPADIKGKITAVGAQYLTVVADSGELHYLSYHGQVGAGVQRLIGERVILRWVSGGTYAWWCAGPEV
jgi:hypothetical protein